MKEVTIIHDDPEFLVVNKPGGLLAVPGRGPERQELHSAHPLGLGIPIVGDALYGHGKEGDQMFLHASSLSFLHPSTGKRIEFISEPDFNKMDAERRYKTQSKS